MDKRWNEMFARLGAIEARLGAVEAQLEKERTPPTVTKEQLVAIKGVGESTADEVLKLLGS